MISTPSSALGCLPFFPMEWTILHAAGAGSWGPYTSNVERTWRGMPSPVPPVEEAVEPERPPRLLHLGELTWLGGSQGRLPEEGAQIVPVGVSCVEEGRKGFLGEGNHRHKTGLVGLAQLTTLRFFSVCVCMLGMREC